MHISLEGIGLAAVTMKVAEGTEEGSAVRMTEDMTVGTAEDGGTFCGVLLSKEHDGAGAVQLAGMAELPYSGTAPDVGDVMLAGDGTGGVKRAESGGVTVLVLAVDEEKQTVVIKL